MSGSVALPGTSSLLARLQAAPPRCRRVILLAAAIIVMSLGDLALTLTYLQSLGMAESNPLARLVIEFGSPALLIVWKLATVTACVSILVWKSRAPSAEVGAWIAAILLCGLMLHWKNYVRTAPPAPPSIAAGSPTLDDRWTTLGTPRRPMRTP
ncbi:MAG: DUF5658 family protein [Phycisphaerales bacterium]